jgi:hypothetical protein
VSVQTSGIEARARLQAETKLLTRHREEYRRMAKKKGHVAAVRDLVKAHKPEYDRRVQEAVIRNRGASDRAQPAA